jgi:nitrate/TMAO reductase-like tetraheme cytochrome c subunit
MATRTLPDLIRSAARPLFYLGNNRASQIGVAVTTASAITMLTFYTTEFFGVRAGPYVGILTYLCLPAVFVGGLAMIPAGIAHKLRRERQGGVLPATWPQVRLDDPRFVQFLLFVAVMTGVNLVLLLTATYRGVHYMDSTQFCGQTCHTVMQPEYAAYQGSPHARVSCVECHIGPGAPWFVKSKLSGAYQVLSVAFDLYQRPIPTPIENLRPSRETCEQCHWPLKFHGDKVKVIAHFADDDANKRTQNVLLMHTGGLDPLTRKPSGNHGVHLQPGVEIAYFADDPRRQKIPYVRVKAPDGKVTEYVNVDDAKHLDRYRRQKLRAMDCMDCHNRPTHAFEALDRALDEALQSRLIDASLPGIKKQAKVLLETKWPAHAEGPDRIRAALSDAYAKHHPEIAAKRRADVERAADAIARVWQRNVFPEMAITWGTYPNNIGHEAFPGCFRCHDGGHATADLKRTITNDCSACHTLLAEDEEDPEILKTLAGE